MFLISCNDSTQNAKQNQPSSNENSTKLDERAKTLEIKEQELKKKEEELKAKSLEVAIDKHPSNSNDCRNYEGHYKDQFNDELEITKLENNSYKMKSFFTSGKQRVDIFKCENGILTGAFNFIIVFEGNKLIVSEKEYIKQ
ncbi:MAG: hypothetical protein IPJ26_15885 [Bacteroidetes bacterium]|nr:hypothetical protein [Bacteroidota bacterium]